ncbi:uncharacterized protein [Henckelia pumila]|uniref:uncharacterized protein n=1 Tax=Henckelia pumila TaxID=405737 RepID=UPI003C6DD828
MLTEGLIFDNVHNFKDILVRYTIQEGINLKKLKNDKVRVTATWAHTCVRNLKSSGATASWIANEFREEYKYNQEKSVEDLNSALRSKYGMHASSSKLFRARKIAMQAAMGDHETSYAKIPRYITAIKDSYGGAFIKLKCDGLDINNQICTPKFERIFISFESQYQGYIKGCRPFIGVDGCFLKGPYRGEVLSAVTLDANSGIFPLAIMICEGETYLKQDFDDAMEKIKETDPAAYKWLMEKCGEHTSTWSRHGFDTTSEMDHVTNNMSESFNAFTGKMRKMPIITLLEWYRRKIMKRFFTRYSKALNWKTKLPPNVNAKVEKKSKRRKEVTSNAGI